LDAAGSAGLSFGDLQARTALKKEVLAKAIDANTASRAIVDAGGHYVVAGAVDALSRSAEAAIESFHQHDPLAKGMSREALREKVFAHLPVEVFQSVITSLELSGKIVFDRDAIRLAAYKTKLSPTEGVLSEKILAIYKTVRLEVPKLDDALDRAIEGTNFKREDARKFFRLFLDSGEIVKVTDEFYFARDSIDGLIEKVRQFAAKTSDRTIDVSKFKELAGISRKYAIPLLEYFDREHITSRAGDKRLIL
jgi:selenocysteine-specific elongation factor